MVLRKHLPFLSATLISLLGLPAVAVPASQNQTRQRPTPPEIARPQPGRPSVSPRLDDHVNGIMERQHIPGMAVVILRNNQVQEIKGYGVADLETQQPVTPDTKFAIGSITKPFTAMAIMMLVEEGKVDLDQPISRYLTELPEEWEALTLRQLLSHTSGISENGFWRKREQPNDFLKNTQATLDFPTGESWMYSNSGFYVAGLILEQVTGQTYENFMQDRIYTPLGMTQTQAKLAPSPTLATGYFWNERRERYKAVGDLPKINPFAFSAGNIISTARDMAKWSQALNQKTLLSAESYQHLWTTTPLKNGRIVQHGLGWFIDNFNGHSWMQHGGNVAGYSSGLLRAPDEQLDVIILSNNVDARGNAIARSIASVFEPSMSLVGMKTQSDPNPALTERYLALLQGKKESIPFAPELQLSRNTGRGKYWQKRMRKFRSIQSLDFIHTDMKDGDRTYYFKTTVDGKTAYPSVKVTQQEQVAGFGVFQPL